jgi:hypothetical protein
MIEDGIVVYAKSSHLEKGKPFEFALSLLSAGIRLICSSRHTMNAPTRDTTFWVFVTVW